METNGQKIRKVATHALTGTVLASTWWRIDDGSAEQELAEKVQKWNKAYAATNSEIETVNVPISETPIEMRVLPETSQPVEKTFDLRAELEALLKKYEDWKAYVENQAEQKLYDQTRLLRAELEAALVELDKVTGISTLTVSGAKMSHD